MTDGRTPRLLAVALLVATGCGQHEPPAIPIGLLLSYTGVLAANSVNSERALFMAIDAANAAGGVSGATLSVLARDTRSAPAQVSAPTAALMDAGVTLFIGPDTPELVVELKPQLGDHLVLLPSFTTSSIFAKPDTWFVMGAPPSRIACELQARVQEDGRTQPLVIADPYGYSSLLAYQINQQYSIPWIFLPAREPANPMTVMPILASPSDAYLLATLPNSASALIYTLSALGAVKESSRWYLSPTLHNAALFETIPRGMLVGAHGVAAGPLEGRTAFVDRYRARWADVPLDEAYAFYDAAAVSALALQSGSNPSAALPAGTALVPDIVAVTRPGASEVAWDQIDRGLELLRQGQEITYRGLTGPLAFDTLGQSAVAPTYWWDVTPAGITDSASRSQCP
jgi:ABC-type branched-subunit amino acid transport system substrate-binding protein